MVAVDEQSGVVTVKCLGELVEEVDQLLCGVAGELEQAIFQNLAAKHRSAEPFVWTRTTDEILKSLGPWCMRTSH